MSSSESVSFAGSGPSTRPASIRSVSDPSAIHGTRMHQTQTLAALRDVVSRPSPLEAFLKDPEAKDWLNRKSSSRSLSRSLFRRGSSRSTTNVDDSRSSADADDDDDESPHRHSRPRSSHHDENTPLRRVGSTATLVNTILTEEARSSAQVRSALKTTITRLDGESRAAAEATARADHAERTARDLGARLAAAETGRAKALTDAVALREEVVRLKSQLEVARSQYATSAAELDASRAAKANSDADMVRYRERARKAEVALADAAAREDGRRTGIRSAMKQNYELGRADGHAAGHDEGYDTGHLEGFEEGRDEGFQAGRLTAFEDGRARGREEGRAEGYEDGYDAGRRHAQEHALRAMDQAMEEESRAKISQQQQQQQQQRPMWLKRRVTGDGQPGPSHSQSQSQSEER